MSLPRSIDRADLGGSTVSLPSLTEILVLTGPNLQTPKDTSFLVCLCTLNLTLGSSVTGYQIRIRQGSSTTGTQIGQTYTFSAGTASASYNDQVMVSTYQQFTDYFQFCLTVQQTGTASAGVVNAATMLAVSF